MTDNILKKQVERTAKELVGRTVTLGLDFSDLGKPFGGEGMEGMAKGWDGARHCTAYGHDFISVSVVGPGFADAVPVYVKIARGRKSKGDLLNEAIEAVKKVVVESRVGGHAIWLYVTCPDSAFEDVTEMRRLANLRSLIGEERIRNITGRPRKPPEKEPGQLEFAFPDVV